ncbi:hypothetical protein D3C80_1493870 [compost metagenome]
MKFGSFSLECLLQNPHGTGEVINGFNQTHIDGGRVRIIGGLAEIYVIIRVQIAVITLFMPQDFQGSVGNNLVGIHVR